MSLPELSETLAEWLMRLEGAHPVTIEMGLDRVLRVSANMGLKFNVPVVVVAGTNGKGSTCAMIDSVARASGLRVGLYSKPHLLQFEERCRVNGHMVSAEQLVAQFKVVEQARNEITLTYFEHTTLAILNLLSQAPIDLAILEVGLGGRLDAVNVIDADCAVITGIDIDHTELLGSDRESIGREKAGIFRKGRPAVLGDAAPPVSLLQMADTLGARVTFAGQDFHWVQRTEDRWDWTGSLGGHIDLPRPALLGRFQIQNASTALAALDVLAGMGAIPRPDDAAVAQGLREVSLPGRFQQLQQSPQIVVDVAHNRQSALALAENLRLAPVKGTTRAVFGCMRDKDIPSILEVMSSQIDAWHLSDLPLPRAARASEIEALTQQVHSTSIRIWHEVDDAMNASLAESKPDDRVVVFGSFHTVGEALRWHHRRHCQP